MAERLSVGQDLTNQINVWAKLAKEVGWKQSEAEYADPMLEGLKRLATSPQLSRVTQVRIGRGIPLFVDPDIPIYLLLKGASIKFCRRDARMLKSNLGIRLPQTPYITTMELGESSSARGLKIALILDEEHRHAGSIHEGVASYLRKPSFFKYTSLVLPGSELGKDGVPELVQKRKITKLGVRSVDSALVEERQKYAILFGIQPIALPLAT